MPADNFTNLRRAVALLQAGRTLPPDLSQWLRGSLTAILRGSPPGDVFGLRGEPSRRAPATRARYAQRDGAIASLFSLATGPQERRAGLILEWSDGSRRPPPEAGPLLAEIQSAGLPLPDVRRVVEIATSATAHDMTAVPPHATMPSASEAAHGGER